MKRMPACAESSHQQHRFLLPFFKDNEKTMATYKESTESNPELKADIELLGKILAGEEQCSNHRYRPLSVGTKKQKKTNEGGTKCFCGYRQA